jgi:hypothetical protein
MNTMLDPQDPWWVRVLWSVFLYGVLITFALGFLYIL